MSVETPTVLGPAEVAPGHRFSDPEHARTDQATMAMMLERFADVLAAAGEIPEPIVDYCPSHDQWNRRVMIPEPSVFQGGQVVTVVGFFGSRRHGVTTEMCERIQQLSDSLFLAIPTVPGVWGYITQLLVDGFNYANVVLVDSPEVILRWRETAPHAVAASVVSPEYYEHVRIYNGEVPVRRLGDSSALDLRSVKYWDFKETPAWTAVRHYRPRTGAAPS